MKLTADDKAETEIGMDGEILLLFLPNSGTEELGKISPDHKWTDII